MTRYDIRIDELVLHGVPPEIAEGIGPLVEARLAELAAGADARPTGPVRTGSDLADRVAHTVWQQIGGQP